MTITTFINAANYGKSISVVFLYFFHEIELLGFIFILVHFFKNLEYIDSDKEK